MTLPLNRQWAYGYDAAGNLVQTVDANGNATPDPNDGKTAYTYNRAGRLTAIDYSDSTPDVTFAYDPAGNRTSMTDGQGTQTYAYDPVNRLTQVTRGTDTFSYLYDLGGNLTRRTYPDPTVVDYAYDDDSRPASVVSAGQTTSYAYDAASNLTQTTLPAVNGYVEERTYDRSGRLTRVKNVKGSSVLADFSYTLDPVGNPTQVVRAGSLPGTQTYEYDVRDRLTQVCYGASCPASDYIRWTYDPVGNRLTEARPSGTTTYTYNAADELTQAGAISYSYDQNGNETQAGSRTFAYDLANRLLSTTASGQTTTYAYDGDSKRLQATTGAQTTKFLWDTTHGLAQLALERDGAGALLRRYLYGNRRISVTSGGSAFYYHYDGLGSVANLTSSTGVSQWTYAYEPFGTTRTETQDDAAAPQNPLKFTGELLDPTGLYYLRARQYDSTTGRFLGIDPLERSVEESALSTYLYADDRPTLLADPSGEGPTFASGDGAGAADMVTRSVSSAVACTKRMSVLIVVFQYFPKVTSNNCWTPNRVIQNAGQNGKTWSVCRWKGKRRGGKGAPHVLYEETNPDRPPYAEIRRMNACGANLREGQSFDVLMAPSRRTLEWTRRTESTAEVRRYFAEVYSNEFEADDLWGLWQRGRRGAGPANSFAMFNIHPLVEKWKYPKKGTVSGKVEEWCRDGDTQRWMGIYSGAKSNPRFGELGKIVPADIEAFRTAMNECTRSREK